MCGCVDVGGCGWMCGCVWVGCGWKDGWMDGSFVHPTRAPQTPTEPLNLQTTHCDDVISEAYFDSNNAISRDAVGRRSKYARLISARARPPQLEAGNHSCEVCAERKHFSLRLSTSRTYAHIHRSMPKKYHLNLELAMTILWGWMCVLEDQLVHCKHQSRAY